LRPFVDMRYQGQSSEISVAAPLGDVTRAVLQELVGEFHDEHERSYGYRADNANVQCVTLRLRARALTPRGSDMGVAQVTGPLHLEAAPRAPAERRAYFGPRLGWLETHVISRGDLSDAPQPGPAIVEEYDSTVVVPPGALISRDRLNNIHMDVS